MKNEERYFPSNGTEGTAFMERWCVRCNKDPYSRNPKAKTKCDILLKSFFCEYGAIKQWIYVDGKPTCTSFIDYRTYKPKSKRVNKLQGQLSNK